MKVYICIIICSSKLASYLSHSTLMLFRLHYLKPMPRCLLNVRITKCLGLALRPAPTALRPCPRTAAPPLLPAAAVLAASSVAGSTVRAVNLGSFLRWTALEVPPDGVPGADEAGRVDALAPMFTNFPKEFGHRRLLVHLDKRPAPAVFRQTPGAEVIDVGVPRHFIHHLGERFVPVPYGEDDGHLDALLLVELVLVVLPAQGYHPPDLNGVVDAEAVALLPFTADRFRRSGHRQICDFFGGHASDRDLLVLHAPYAALLEFLDGLSPHILPEIVG